MFHIKKIINQVKKEEVRNIWSQFPQESGLILVEFLFNFPIQIPQIS